MEKNFTIKQITFDLLMEAKQKDVWHYLVNETGKWWNREFFTNERTVQFVIENKVGGRMFEDFGNNEGVLWANIIVLDSPSNIEFLGMLTPQFGGPALSFSKWSLSQEGKFTRFTLSETLTGAIDMNTLNELEKGWRTIFEDGFKNYVESKRFQPIT